MANRVVALVYYCKTPSGWRRYPAVIGKNGKIKPGAVMVNKVEQNFPQGTYQLHSYRGKNPHYESIGTNPRDALTVLQKAQKKSDVRVNARKVGIELVEEKDKQELQAAFDTFHEGTVPGGALSRQSTTSRRLTTSWRTPASRTWMS